MVENTVTSQATQTVAPEAPETAVETASDLSLIQRVLAAVDGYKTGAGIVLLFLAYAFTEHCRIWGIDIQAHAWINPLSETLDWWGQAFLLLGGGHKVIKNKEFFQNMFNTMQSNAQSLTG